MIYCLLMLIICMLFGYFSQKHSERLVNEKGEVWGPDENGAYAKLEFWSIALILVLVVMCGLRVNYNDTVNYTTGFAYSGTLDEVLSNTYQLGDCPGFLYLQGAVKSLTDNKHVFIMVCAAATLPSMIIFLKRYSANFFLSMFLFVASHQLLFSLAAMKQAIAIAIAIWAVPLYLKKKYLWALLLILLAATFHPYVLLYLAIPLLTAKPWGGSTLFIGLVIAGVAVFFQTGLEIVLDFATSLGDSFTEDEFSDTGVNIFRVLVYLVTAVLSLVFVDRIRQDDNKYQHTFINIAILSSGIMFLALFGTANLIGRVANYLSLFMALSLPYIISRLEKKSATAMTGMTVILYLAYYLYGIRGIHYTQITLAEFWESLVR